MGKSRGYVKEQFAWRHYYWYLTKASDTSATTFICPQRLSLPPSKGNPDLMLAQDPVPEPPVAVLSVINLLMGIVLLTEERPEPELATKLVLPVLDLPLWNSEEDLAEARRNKFIM